MDVKPVERPTWWRDVAVVVGLVVLGLAGMRGSRVPLLSLVDLGFHELGHLVCYIVRPGELVTAAAGSFTQVAVPLGLAAYFIWRRHDRVGAAVCLGWAATSAQAASRYIADAPYERLELIAGDHDWAFFFSVDGIDAMDKAGTVATRVVAFAWLVYLASFAVVAAPYVLGSRTVERAENRRASLGRIVPR